MNESTKNSSATASLCATALTVLAKTDTTLMQLTQAVELLESENQYRTLKIGISSSVTVDLLNIYLRKYGILNETKIKLVTGNYDDPISDINQFIKTGVEQVVLLPFFDNLLPSFEAQLVTLDPAILDAKEAELRQRYRMVFDKARAMHTVYLGTFHRFSVAAEASGQDVVALTLLRFNNALREEATLFSNIRFIDTQNIISAIGHNVAFDNRFYFRSKAPYTGQYMNQLAYSISAAARGFGTHFYKVLALDCDNTLWGGVIGEDLLGGIKLSPYDYPGNIFWRMQHEFAALEHHGILLALISKNNLVDVDEVLVNHPDMVLRDKNIIAKKVNWKDKPTNLRALAQELNVGLDSIIFLDDSSFECEAVRLQLPMVKTLQVPSNLSDFPYVVDKIKTLFLAGGVSADGQKKTEQYRQRANSEELKAQFQTQEDYLASLEIKIELARNARANTARISELSQKSNQFNLSTNRYSVADIDRMMTSDNYSVYSLNVKDKFGNAGLTGVVTLYYEGSIINIENFFMSCRVIGRGVEVAIWKQIFDNAVVCGYTEIRAKYIPSAKNAQVANFYERIGFQLLDENLDGVRRYRLAVDDFIFPTTPWIEMTYVE